MQSTIAILIAIAVVGQLLQTLGSPNGATNVTVGAFDYITTAPAPSDNSTIAVEKLNPSVYVVLEGLAVVGGVILVAVVGVAIHFMFRRRTRTYEE